MAWHCRQDTTRPLVSGRQTLVDGLHLSDLRVLENPVVYIAGKLLEFLTGDVE
jgi:hypothetical protein